MGWGTAWASVPGEEVERLSGGGQRPLLCSQTLRASLRGKETAFVQPLTLSRCLKPHKRVELILIKHLLCATPCSGQSWSKSSVCPYPSAPGKAKA